MHLWDEETVRDLADRAGFVRLRANARAVALFACGVAVAYVAFRAGAIGAVQTQPLVPAVANAPASAESSAGVVLVHVAGAVQNPGVYELADGSRVVDAIDAAGGTLADAALADLNLARLLTDGEQVRVSANGEGSADGSSGTKPDGRVDINRASAAELEDLPGIGPASAKAIVDDREENGPFRRAEDLMRVPGIGPKKFDALKDLVSVG